MSEGQLKATADAHADAVVAIAKEAGFSISADDLNKAQAEVSDEELKGIAGGPLLLGGWTECSNWSDEERIKAMGR